LTQSIYLFDAFWHKDLLPLGKIKDIETVAAAQRGNPMTKLFVQSPCRRFPVGIHL
jgi:hypothetical protein